MLYFYRPSLITQRIPNHRASGEETTMLVSVLINRDPSSEFSNKSKIEISKNHQNGDLI